MTSRRFPPPWDIEEYGAASCVATTTVRAFWGTAGVALVRLISNA